MQMILGLAAETIVLDQPAEDLRDVVEVAAEVLATASGVARSVLRRSLEQATADAAFALGHGLAVPHAAVDGLRRRAVCFVRTAPAVAMPTPDGIPVDRFFVVLYPAGDAAGHLRFLAHLSGMCRSRLFREGLAAAADARAVLDLVANAEARLSRSQPPARDMGDRPCLALIWVRGERAADNIVVELLGHDLGEASILEAQSVREAASREVPLFAGFRDLFGDPGGQRVIVAHISEAVADVVAATVQRVCEDEPGASAEMTVVPVAQRWAWGTANAEPARGRAGAAH